MRAKPMRNQQEEHFAQDVNEGGVVNAASELKQRDQPCQPQRHQHRHRDHVAPEIGAQPERHEREREPGSGELRGVDDELVSGHDERQADSGKASAGDYRACARDGRDRP